MIAVSILNIKDDNTKITEIDKFNPDYIHVDVMDGEFVTNKVDFLNLPQVKSKIDVHLMVYDIKKYIEEYKRYNPEYITFHLEATNENEIKNIINYIKSLGIKVGISIKPNTPVTSILSYLDNIDLVLVMSVEPGLGGQSFLDSATSKINELVNLRNINNYNYVIEVDGGVNNLTLDKCNGADILVVGSYITMSDNPEECYKRMIKSTK